MRLLTNEEMKLVAGGDKSACTPEDAKNVFYGISNTNSLGQDLVNIYEGLVFGTSHVIERVANALKY